MNYLKFKSSRIDIDLSFVDKYTFINGDSGSGKSLFIEQLNMALDITPESIECPLNIIVINSTKQLNSIALENDSTELLICDEPFARALINFVKGKYVYVIIVTRKVYSDLNFSYRCLHTLYREDGIAKIKSSFNFISADTIKDFDLIICEDSGYAFEYFKNILSDYNVETAQGKDNICNVIKAYCKKSDKVLIICDAVGIGTVINKIKKSISCSCIESRFILHESFEFSLLCSDFIGYEYNLYKYCPLSEDNPERFCEKKLTELTKDTSIECNHDTGVMTDCWLKECDGCTVTCTYHIYGNKVEHVLKKGPISSLLSLL